MTDRELLDMAAKAAGIKVKGIYEDEDTLQIKPGPGMPPARWNPLTDDGDALRLAVKLEMMVDTVNRVVSGYLSDINVDIDFEEQESDLCAATRRAIVRAAAEIGKAM